MIRQSGKKLLLLRWLASNGYRFRGTGLPRISDWIRRIVVQSEQSRDSVEITDFMGRLHFLVDLSEHMGSQIFFRGAYSLDQLLLLQGILTEESVFLDVGANQGEFTVFAASIARHGRVYAYEPIASTRSRLHRNVSINGISNVSILDYALGDENEDHVEIYSSHQAFSNGSRNSGLCTLYRQGDRTECVEHIHVRRLDDVFDFSSPRVDLIKIDVEGAELAALKGMTKVISKYRPRIIFEANEGTSRAAGYEVKDLVSWIESHEYLVQEIGWHGQLEPLGALRAFANLLASPKASADASQ